MKKCSGAMPLDTWKVTTMAKKKVNPKRKPVSQADINRAKNEAVNEAVKIGWVIFFTVMRDKEGYSTEDLKRLWAEINDLADGIAQGYVNVADLSNVLKEEEGMVLL